MHRFWWPVLGAFVGVALVWVVVGWLSAPAKTDIRIAGGPHGGTWIKLADSFVHVLQQHPADSPHIGVIAPAIETDGSVDNLQRLVSGKVHFAFVQSDSELADGESTAGVRLVAVLHENVLQIVAGSADIQSVDDLRGRRIYLGPENSGTRQLAERVLRHFGLIDGDTRHFVEPPTSADAKLMFSDCPAMLGGGPDDLHAAFFASGLPTDWVRECYDECPDAHLVPLGTVDTVGSALEGLSMAVPPLEPVAVPTRTYGAKPLQPVGTVTVPTLLVTHRDVPEDVVQEFTRQLFENRSALLRTHAAAARFAEVPDVNTTPYPWHPGAWAHYHRNAPSWFVQYAETMSFVLTAFVLVGSGIITLRGIVRRRRKNRIDVYYLELEDLADRLDSNQTLVPEIRTVRSRLLGLRRRAFTELVAEQLEADASFVIFQDFLHAQLSTAEHLISERTLEEDAPAEGS